MTRASSRLETERIRVRRTELSRQAEAVRGVRDSESTIGVARRRGPRERVGPPPCPGRGRPRRPSRGAGQRLALASLATLAVLSAGASPSGAAARHAGPAIRFAAARTLAAGALRAVACATAQSCVALDSHGRAYHFNGSRWGAARSLGAGASGPGAVSISCAGKAFCVAEPAGADEVVVGNGSTWSSPTPLEGAVGLEAVGCSRAGYCAAVDAEGNSWAYGGGSWERTSGDWGAVASIACVSASFCISAGPSGLSRWDGDRWSAPESFGAASAFTGVSCAGERFCVAVDAGGQALGWNGSRWLAAVRLEPAERSATALGPYPTAISCPAAGVCVAVDDLGATLELMSGRWSRSSTGSSHVFTSVACPDASFCIATDRRGQALTGRP
jgi:hypothetical protein